MGFKSPNYTQVPNEFFDDIAKTLKEGELRILVVIMRQTFGWKKEWDRISLKQMAEKTGMEKKSVTRSINSLLEKNIIKKNKSGPAGEEECWYALSVEEEDSKDSYGCPKDTPPQCPKDTPPSVLKTPTKETITKEKEVVVEKPTTTLSEKGISEKDLKSRIEKFGAKVVYEKLDRIYGHHPDPLSLLDTWLEKDEGRIMNSSLMIEDKNRKYCEDLKLTFGEMMLAVKKVEIGKDCIEFYEGNHHLRLDFTLPDLMEKAKIPLRHKGFMI